MHIVHSVCMTGVFPGVVNKTFLILKLSLLAGAVAGENTQVPVFGEKPVFQLMESWFSGGRGQKLHQGFTWKTGFENRKPENIRGTSSVASLQIRSIPARMS